MRGGKRGLVLAGPGPGASILADDEDSPVLLPSLAFPPIALRIILSTSVTVFELTFTACPLTAWTPASPLRVRSEVRKTRARGGGGGGFVDVEEALVAEEGAWEDGAECEM